MLPTPAVEAIFKFWVQFTQQQYRIAGNASIIPAPSHLYHAKFSPMRGPTLDALSKERIGWEAERHRIFDSRQGYMKASWCCPPPGSKIELYEEGKKWSRKVLNYGEAEREEDKTNLEMVLANFALVVIEPSKWILWNWFSTQTENGEVHQRGEELGGGDCGAIKLAIYDDSCWWGR
jgi:hypothetical protein